MSTPRLLISLMALLLALPLGVAGGATASAAAASSHARVTGADTDGDGLSDETDGCPTVASANPTGCPTAPRKARLKRLKGAGKLQATISSPVASCAARARIKLWLDLPDRADKLLAADASYRGRSRFTVPRGATYYVTVAPFYSSGQAECDRATSRKVRVPRR